MGNALKFIGIIILIVGAGIYLLPVIAPPSGDATELVSRTSTIGGGFIGVGLVMTVIGFIKAKKG